LAAVAGIMAVPFVVDHNLAVAVRGILAVARDSLLTARGSLASTVTKHRIAAEEVVGN
jgi:hypothetical protein